MSLTQLKLEAIELSPAELGEFMAFLAARQIASDDEFRDELTRKIDDQEPSRWLDLDELKKRWED